MYDDHVMIHTVISYISNVIKAKKDDSEEERLAQLYSINIIWGSTLYLFRKIQLVVLKLRAILFKVGT